LNWKGTLETLPILTTAVVSVVVGVLAGRIKPTAVALQLVVATAVPLIVTTPDVPKFDPLSVMAPPTGTHRGVIPVISGRGRMVKFTPLLLTPFTFTTTFPVVAPAGTVTVIELLLQHEGVVQIPDETPLKVTKLIPWLNPKLEPVIVIVSPTAACGALSVAMLGPGLASTTVSTVELLTDPDVAVMVDVP